MVAVGRGRFCAADCLRERRKPVVGQKSGPSERDGDSQRLRGQIGNPLWPAINRGPAVGRCGRGAWLGLWICDAAGVHCHHPPDTLPSEADLRLNLPILLFTMAATTLAGLLFGCAPAWYASRVDAADTLKEGGRSASGAGPHRLRRLLVILEFALALPLLAGAGLAIHSFSNLMRVDLGVRTDHTLTFFLEAPESRPSTPQSTIAYYRKILAGIAAVPGVSHVSVETGTPLLGFGFNPHFAIVGEPGYADPSLRPWVGLLAITPEYFETFGIRVIKGRTFNNRDNFSGVKVAMVNRYFADRFLKGKDPIGMPVSVPQLLPAPVRVGAPVEWQIVGVFHNVRSWGFREDDPEIYVPFWQAPWPSAGVGVRMAGDPMASLKSIASAVHAMDPEVALANPRTMTQVRDDVLASDRFTMILFFSFAAIALLLAAVGILRSDGVLRSAALA